MSLNIVLAWAKSPFWCPSCLAKCCTILYNPFDLRKKLSWQFKTMDFPILSLESESKWPCISKIDRLTQKQLLVSWHQVFQNWVDFDIRGALGSLYKWELFKSWVALDKTQGSLINSIFDDYYLTFISILEILYSLWIAYIKMRIEIKKCHKIYAQSLRKYKYSSSNVIFVSLTKKSNILITWAEELLEFF